MIASPSIRWTRARIPSASMAPSTAVPWPRPVRPQVLRMCPGRPASRRSRADPDRDQCSTHYSVTLREAIDTCLVLPSGQTRVRSVASGSGQESPTPSMVAGRTGCRCSAALLAGRAAQRPRPGSPIRAGRPGLPGRRPAPGSSSGRRLVGKGLERSEAGVFEQGAIVVVGLHVEPPSATRAKNNPCRPPPRRILEPESVAAAGAGAQRRGFEALHPASSGSDSRAMLCPFPPHP